MESFRVTENVKEINLDGNWDKLEETKKITETITHNTCESNSTFQLK